MPQLHKHFNVVRNQMKPSLLTLVAFALFYFAHGQTKSNSFEASKGSWSFPISNILSIDTMMRDCYGMPANSPYLILTSKYPEDVKSIQPGLVQTVIDNESLHLVMVKVGDYFLVYNNISNPVVKEGDLIQKGNVIGKVMKTDSEENYEVTLMLFKGTLNININRWFNWKAAHNSVFIKLRRDVKLSAINHYFASVVN